MITKPKKKETKTYLALIVIGIALVLGCPASSSSGPVTKSVPPAGETKFPADGNIVLTYSGTIVEATGASVPNITVKAGTTAAVTLAGTVTLTANAAVAASAGVAAQAATTTVTIDPTADFALGKIAIAIPAGRFKVDTAAGADVVAYNLSFTAVDPATTGPTATSVPADDATGVAVDANIVLTFDEVVTRGAGTITYALSTGDTTPIAATAGEITIATDKKVVTINPGTNFEASTTGTVTISANAFENTFGNGNVEIVIAFTTQ